MSLVFYTGRLNRFKMLLMADGFYALPYPEEWTILKKVETLLKDESWNYQEIVTGFSS